VFIREVTFIRQVKQLQKISRGIKCIERLLDVFAMMLLSISFIWNRFLVHNPEKIKPRYMKSENLSPERERQISDFIFKACKDYRRSYELQCIVRPEKMLLTFFLFKKNFINLLVYHYNLYHDYVGRIAINSQKFFHQIRKPNNIICILNSHLLVTICVFPFPVNLWFIWTPQNAVCIKYTWDKRLCSYT